jgi:hypothetical protein
LERTGGLRILLLLLPRLTEREKREKREKKLDNIYTHILSSFISFEHIIKAYSTLYSLTSTNKNMADKSSSEGHWESQSHSSKSTKVGHNPASVSGKDASAEGTFDVSEFFLIYIDSILCIIDLFSMVNQ